MAKGTRAETIDRLQKANSRLRASVRQLRKQLKEAEQERALLTDLWAQEIEELRAAKRKRRKESKTPVCPDCGNPTLDVKQIGVWKIERCDACDYFNRTQED